jgi:hypothetical protein
LYQLDCAIFPNLTLPFPKSDQQIACKTHSDKEHDPPTANTSAAEDSTTSTPTHAMPDRQHHFDSKQFWPLSVLRVGLKPTSHRAKHYSPNKEYSIQEDHSQTSLQALEV